MAFGRTFTFSMFNISFINIYCRKEKKSFRWSLRASNKSTLQEYVTDVYAEPPQYEHK